MSDVPELRGADDLPELHEALLGPNDVAQLEADLANCAAIESVVPRPHRAHAATDRLTSRLPAAGETDSGARARTPDAVAHGEAVLQGRGATGGTRSLEMGPVSNDDSRSRLRDRSSR